MYLHNHSIKMIIAQSKIDTPLKTSVLTYYNAITFNFDDRLIYLNI